MNAGERHNLIGEFKSSNNLLADWVAPFFRPGPREEVSFAPGSIHVATMDEELPTPIVIAIFAGYSGTVQPSLGNFDTGNNINLGLDFELNGDNEWQMVVRNRQDYEQGMISYVFDVRADGVTQKVIINIRNIFDNAPVMSSDSNPCRDVEELQAPVYDTGCIFVSSFLKYVEF